MHALRFFNYLLRCRNTPNIAMNKIVPFQYDRAKSHVALLNLLYTKNSFMMTCG